MARIEALVRRLLLEHRVENPPVPVEQIARKLGADIRHIPFEGRGGVSAMLFRDKTQTIIGVNSLHHPNRQRFSIAHEIAHLLLHKGKQLHVDKTLFLNLRDDVSSQAVDPDEIEANRFAAGLIMPRQMILADVEEASFDLENEEDLLNLARRYRVSIQALTYRLTNLGLISLPDNSRGRR
jgi:Zn-dependent peptidase ImmA (M78 family)